MTRRLLAIALSVVALAPAVGGQSARPGDWPQWQGPDRNNLSKETGLLKDWPVAGPPVVWSASGLGSGYGSVAISGDRVFVQGSTARDSNVLALNRADGKQVWSKSAGPALNNDQGPGARGTPTVDGDRLYVLTENGDLTAFRVQDGTALWHRNILKEFGAQNIGWLISESPLVDGDRVVVTPGGSSAGMVALDKMTGKTVWVAKELGDPAGYASIVATDVQGVRTYVTLTSNAGVGVRASDGKLMWSYGRVANQTANIATPLVFDNKVFYSSNYGTGGVLLGLKNEGGIVKAQEIYFTREMQNHHGGVVLVNGYVYGFSGSILTCLEFATGRLAWRHRSVGKGSLTYADGNLYLQGEENIVGLAEASPSAYKEHGRFRIADQGLPSWAHPVVAGGRLYVRNQGTLTAYDIKPH